MSKEKEFPNFENADISIEQIKMILPSMLEENKRHGEMIEAMMNALLPQVIEEDVKEEKIVELPKKSDLIKEQIALEKQYLDGTKEQLKAEYSVKIGSKKSFDDLYKMVEHKFEFDQSLSAGIALLYTNLKQQKPFTREKDWNGSILLKTSSCIVLWRFLNNYRGKGFFEAREFLSMLQLLGEDLSKTVKTINESNRSLTGLHTRLEEIDSILDSGRCEIDLTEEEEKEIRKDQVSLLKSEHDMEDEVDPELTM